MIFTPTGIDGALLIGLEKRHDERGFFARTWCNREAATVGIDQQFVQCSTSFNLRRGTLRGLHYQSKPHEERKLVRCTAGAIFDVLVDIRPESPTYLRWAAFDLTAANGLQLYIPAGVAHGFQTLQDSTEVLYQMNEYYYPEHSRGLAWNDPAFGIDWPEGPRIISERDQQYAPFQP